MTADKPRDEKAARPSGLTTVLGILVGAATYGILMSLMQDQVDRWARVGFAAAAGCVFGLLITWLRKRAG